MTRDEAYQLLIKYLKNKNLIKHSLAAEAAMRGIYSNVIPKDKQNPLEQEIWGITGLLHDIDYEVAQNTDQLELHGKLLFENSEVSLPPEIERAIRSHNFTKTGTTPEEPMEWAITACDQLTGLITACALVRPEKKLSAVNSFAVMKKFSQKAFAAGADRNMIMLCESKLNIPLEQFIAMVLDAMQEIHEDLGL